MKGGRHLVQEKGTPMGNLLLALAHSGGVELERFGDSTGAFSLNYPKGPAAANQAGV